MGSEVSLRVQAEAKYELHLAERRQLSTDHERMSSYTDDAFECESPHAILASSRGVRPQHRCDLPTTEGTSSFLGTDHIDLFRERSVSESNARDELAYDELAQPRPEIILRRKRFAVLVVITAAVMSGIAAWLREGFVVDQKVPVADAETRTDLVNSYIGLTMGFIESIIALGIEEIFPVFIVYLHNLRWYPSDDPATKKQSKLKKFALTIFIPAVMMAVGSSLSAVQANQKEDNSVVLSRSKSATTTRFLMQPERVLGNAGLGDTILKTALARKVTPMQPIQMSQCRSNENELLAEDTLLGAAPKAIFGFPLKEWSIEFGNGWTRGEWTERCEISHAAAGRLADEAKNCKLMPLAMACNLWTQGKPHLLRSVRAPVTDQVTLPVSSMGDLFHDVVTSLLASGLPLTEDTTVNASFATRALSSSMDLQVMTLTLPLRSPTNASVVCGETICSLLEPQFHLKSRLPRKQTGIAPRNTSDSVFVYGFTILTSLEFEAAVVKRSLVLSFGHLSWHFAPSARNACNYDTASPEGCQVLHHQLVDSNRHLVLAKPWLPSRLQESRRDLSVSLVQLLEPAVKLHSRQTAPFATLEHLASWPQDISSTCSATMDTYLQYMKNNHFYLSDDLVETMAASALLYVFQNARVEDTSRDEEGMIVQRRLVETTTRRVRIFLTNTKVGNVCTWTGCSVLLLLTVWVLVLPNERARLAPPRGGNARAERFVSVQTEQIYPNLIYKKRFLIGKTGEEIKFGEFAVESVGLHHKMEEDEQIYI